MFLSKIIDNEFMKYFFNKSSDQNKVNH